MIDPSEQQPGSHGTQSPRPTILCFTCSRVLLDSAVSSGRLTMTAAFNAPVRLHILGVLGPLSLLRSPNPDPGANKTLTG